MKMKLSAKNILDYSVGLHGDGNGLYLQVAQSGTRSWIYRYQLYGKRRDLGLGGFPSVSLANARRDRDKKRMLVKAGIDPLNVKAKQKALAQEHVVSQKRKAKTFQVCAEEYIAKKEAEWKNAKHGQQWVNTLTQYAFPIIGNTSVEDIENEQILQILNPIWLTKTETATRVRNRIELVLDYASALKYRSSENPARWRGNLEAILPKPSKIRTVKHHKALPYREISQFMSDLSQRDGLAARALELTILTAARTSETLNSTWGEFDLEQKVWTIPASRMKMNKEHRIPLSSTALNILSLLGQTNESSYVFPGMKQYKPLSNMSMATLLRRMERTDITVHGFRSTFRDWIAETTNFPQRVAETALAHKLKDNAEAAYQRGDLIEKRRKLMKAWANYCYSKESSVSRIYG
jgi:integrase